MQKNVLCVFRAYFLCVGGIGISLFPALSSGQSFFKGLGDLPGGNFESVALGVSADGSVVVGYSKSANGQEAFRWTEDTGMVGLGDLPGSSFYSVASGASADGSVIVGYGTSSNGQEAFRWTQTAGMVGLGDLSGGGFSSTASGVSWDGTVVVGQGYSANGFEAFRWTAATGMVGLGDLPGGGFSSIALAVSEDGSVIVGSGYLGNGFEAFRWTETTGMVGLGDLPGGNFSEAYGVSADGSVVVGRGTSANGYEAFRWTWLEGMVGLGDLPDGGFDSRAHSVSGDGSVIVGQAFSSNGYEAFIWDSVYGMRSVSDWLKANGVSVPPGWVLGTAYDVAVHNGFAIVVGTGWNPSGQTEAWIARVPLSTTLQPEAFVIVRGELVQGGLNELLLSDDKKLFIKRPRSISLTGVQIMLDVKSHFEGTNVTKLGFTLETASSEGGANQKVLFKNYQTGTFEEVDSRTATFSDSTAQIIISENPSRFVHPQTGEVYARIVWTKTGFVPANWMTAADFVAWQIWSQ
ncbi:MAG TPA: hypothetical protein VNK96_01735 [Fimbriimonadales bacterium]|nr:hypothetical protein [Fimbriimonadales bacterium]